MFDKNSKSERHTHKPVGNDIPLTKNIGAAWSVRYSETFQNSISVDFPIAITIAPYLIRKQFYWSTTGWLDTPKAQTRTRTKGAFDEIVTCHQSQGVRGPKSWVETHKIMDVWEVFGSIGGNFVEFSVKDAIYNIYETHTRARCITRHKHRKPNSFHYHNKYIIIYVCIRISDTTHTYICI